MRARSIPVLLLGALALAGCSSTPEPREFDEDASWPHHFEGPEGRLELFQPQLSRWDGYTTLEARAPIALTPAGTSTTYLGSLRFRALTTTDMEERTVVLHHIEVVDGRFTSAPPIDVPGLRRALEGLVPRDPVEIPLEYVLALASVMEESKPAPEATPRQVTVNLEPPPIFVSREEAVLVQFLGKPAFRPVEGATGLEVALNTTSDVLRETLTGVIYLRSGKGWLSTKELEKGPWEPVTELPALFGKLPDNPSWAEARAAVPGAPLTPAPRVFVATQPSELICIEGREAGQPIPGTELQVITNVVGECDLFFHPQQRSYYFLVAGRWFTATSLDGPWTSAQGKLPADFSRIPASHAKAHVRASVPGTPEAAEAVMRASIPQQATVTRAGTTVTPVYVGVPVWIRIEGTSIDYALNTTFDVFRLEGGYYVCHQAVWFVGPTHEGPFAVCENVPAALYAIPSTSPKFHVTYVRVYKTTPEAVVVGYTAGYVGMYVSAGLMYYGCGYPWYYDDDCWSYYNQYPYAYGSGAWYDSSTGLYRANSTIYGPYGGVTRGAAYDPVTGAYARGAQAWGPNGTAYAARAYDPSTGRSAATRQASTPYASWGQSAVRHGNDWARTAHYSDQRGSAGAFKTSGGAAGAGYRGQEGSGGAVRTGSGDLYVGKDGEVYRRTEGGDWEHNGENGWESADRPERSEAQRAEAREKVEARRGEGSSWSRDFETSRGDMERNSEARARGSYNTDRSWSGGARGGGGSYGGGGSRGGGGARGGGGSRGGGGRRR